MFITRFAPSPTGLLHLGNLRIALLCYLYSQKENGQFILRIDDTDQKRCLPEYIDNILQDLEWMGLTWSSSFYQSSRLSRYAEVVSYLKSAGRIYPCYENKEELEIKKKLLLKRGLPPVYDRSSLHLRNDERDQLLFEGRSPHYRFLLEDNSKIRWTDQVRGEIKFSYDKISDPVIIREDGRYTYMLPSVIDDLDFNISHIIRGEDHISNTAIQISMINSLKGNVPEFAHISLLHDKHGKLSKRRASISLRSLKDAGIENKTILSYLSRIGTSLPIYPELSISNLVSAFDIGSFSSSSAIMDVDMIKKLNAKIVKKLPYEDIKKRYDINEELWNIIKPNIDYIDEIEIWQNIYSEKFSVTSVSNYQLLEKIIMILSDVQWSIDTWKYALKKIKDKTQERTSSICLLIRQALTGSTKGPEIYKILFLLGKDRVIDRLNAVAQVSKDT